METNTVLIYLAEDGKIKIETRLENDTVWLTQDQMAQLFGKGRSTITEHISNIYKEEELDALATRRNFRQVRLEGNRSVERDLEHYNLDVIISVGYRVKSVQGTRFRQWATTRLKEYLIKSLLFNFYDSINYKELIFNDFLFNLNSESKCLLFNYTSTISCNALIFNDFLFNLNSEKLECKQEN